MRYFLLTMWALFTLADANYPVFEGAGQLKELLVPADVHIGSVIYRLRASDSDHDYPLQFDATDYGSYVVKVENLPCNINSTHCEANVYLERVLMVGQVFKFRFTVRDTKGDTTTASVSVEVTDAPVDITNTFPHLPGIIILPENTKPGTELEYVIVRRNPEHKKPAYLEIRGSPMVDFGRMRTSQETTTGVIVLKKGLDFEQQNMYKLQIFALDMYTDKLVDSRNIAGFEIILIVEDVQDTPPVFVGIEPTIKLKSNLTQGDNVTKVTAVDGDRGNPRQITYGLVSENNPFTIFFNIDRVSGQIALIKPLKQLTAIARSHQPILLTILAEEERSNIKDAPSMSTTATIALLLAEAGNTPPYFDNDHYVCYLNENSPQGTALIFSDAYSTQVYDDDMGKQGVFSLILEKNNGTFEISPNVVERKAYFTIRVRNNLLLDYEARKSVEFVIVARELDPGSLSSSVTVLVYLNDVNDNGPKFQKTMYMAQIPENVTANAYVTEVLAIDVDTGLSGTVHYTRIHGFKNSSLLLNSVTGVITVASDNHGFDREEASEYQMTVEARDTEGVGLLCTVPLIIRILDVNDETPTFENTPFHFTLSSDLKNFSTKALIKATDKDAEPPNNFVRYEIISGNYNNKFILNAETGELTVHHPEVANGLRKRQVGSAGSSNVHVLTIRAYDLGVPHRWSTAQVRIFPPDTGTRLLTFIIPAKGLDYEQMEELLIKLTGGRVTIVEIKPYLTHRYSRSVDVSRKPLTKEKSVVIARVTYSDNSVIDVEHVYYLLQPIYYNGIADTDQAEYHRAETSTNIFWILLILLLLLIAFFIALLLCYLLKCRPCYAFFRTEKKKNQVSGAMQTINLQNKGVQANNHRLDTRSSTDSGHRNRWKFYRRREHDQPLLLIPKTVSPIHYQNTSFNENVPAFIYRADLQNMERHGDLYIQDIADNEYHILDPAKLNVQRLTESDIRGRKFHDKNSTERKCCDVSATSREETFVREGQAEILRLQTNEDSLIEETLLHQPDKKYHHHFDTNNTSKNNSTHEQSELNSIKKSSNNYIDQHVLFSTNEQLEKPKFVRSKEHISTDPEEEDHSYPENLPYALNPPNPSQPSTSNEKLSNSITKLNVVNYLSKTNPETDNPESETFRVIDPQVVNDHDEHIFQINANSQLETQPFPEDHSKPESRNSQPNQALQPAEAFRQMLDISHLEEERNRLTSFQRDILLTRFLVEEQRRFLNHTVDTQSLPGSLSMGTQTDRHRSTQTDLLCLMRPEPRKVKSENDDSSDSDADCLYKKGYRRCYSVIGKDKCRYKIRTPIMEESESIEGVRQLSHRENRSSLLRLANSRNKINTREAITETKQKLDLKNSKNKCKSSTDLVETKPHHVSLRDFKKSVSHTDINDNQYILSDKEMYTPRSLKSRLIARRLSASEPPKLGAHCLSHAQQDARDRQKAMEKDPCAATWSKTCESRRKTAVEKGKCRNTKKQNADKQNSPGSNASSGAKSGENEENGEISPPVTGAVTLKLKGKNQQLMEKKSVFTIAYDDAATQHIGASSNGSMQE